MRRAWPIRPMWTRPARWRKLEGEVDGFRKGWESFRNSVWSPARAMMDEAHKSLRGFDSATNLRLTIYPSARPSSAVTTQKIVAVRPAPASPHTQRRWRAYRRPAATHHQRYRLVERAWYRRCQTALK